MSSFTYKTYDESGGEFLNSSEGVYFDSVEYLTSTEYLDSTEDETRLVSYAEMKRYVDAKGLNDISSQLSPFFALWEQMGNTLRFTAQEDGSSIQLYNYNNSPTVYYRINSTGAYQLLNDDDTISIDEGEWIDMYGDNPDGFSHDVLQYSSFGMSGTISASGNIQALINQNCPNYIPCNYCYAYIFDDCTNLVSAPALPATTLAYGCYESMFEGCESLVSAPALPATNLASSCYESMFLDCTSLVSAPALPATNLASSCYNCMFQACTSLVSAPELPATTLAQYCYYNMFEECVSLVSAPALPATTLAQYCYAYMFYNCTSLVSAPVLPATALASYCYLGMFGGCTSLVSVPALPATTLAQYCYASMFSGCTSLIQSPELPATTLAQYCYAYMFYGCTKLNYIKALFTTTPSTTYTLYWVSGVASTGTFVKSASATWDVTGINGIPSGWTVETASS